MSKKRKKAKKVDKAEHAKRMKALGEIDMSWMSPGKTWASEVGSLFFKMRRRGFNFLRE